MTGTAKPDKSLERENEILKERISEFEKRDEDHSKMRMELDQVERRMSTIYDTMTEHLLLQDRDHKILWVNKSVTDMFEVSSEDLIGKKCYDLWYNRSSPCSECPIEKVWDTGEVSSGDALTRARRQMFYQAFPIYDKEGNLESVLEVGRDVTNDREMVTALEEMKERNRTLADAAFDIICIHDGVKILEANKASSVVTGYSLDELIGMSVLDLVAPEDKERTIENMRIGNEEPIELIGLKKDGTRMPAEVVGASIPYHGGKARVTTIRDLTKKKNQEEALRRSEEQYRSIVTNIPDVLWRIASSGEIQFVTSNIKDVLGYTDEEFCDAGNDLWSSLIHPDFQAQVDTMFQELLEGKRNSYDMEYRIKRKDGEFIWAHDRAFAHGEVDGEMVYDGIFRDVTAEKEADDALSSTEERYKFLAENVADVIFVLNDDLTFNYVSPSFERMTGFTVEELLNMGWRDMLSPDSMEKAMEYIGEKLIEGLESGQIDKGSILMEMEILTKTGNAIWTEVNISLLADEKGDVSNIMGVARDISDRKASDEAIRESEERYRTLADATFDGILIHKRGRIFDVNKGFASIFGYEAEELLEMRPYDLVSPEDKDRVVKIIQKDFGGPFEFIGLTKEGNRIIVEAVGKRMPYKGELMRVVAVRDITGRKQAEEAIKESEERYRILAENVRDVIWTMDIDMNFTYVSPSILKQRGYTVEEAMGQQIVDILTPESNEIAMGFMDEFLVPALNGKADIDFSVTKELEMLRSDGSTLWTETSFSYIMDEQGELKSILGVSRDITDRKIAEAINEESERRYRLLAEYSGDVIVVVNHELELEYVSPSYEKLTGFSTDSLMERGWMSLITEQSYDKVMELVAEGFETMIGSDDPAKGNMILTVNLKAKNDTSIPVEINVSPFMDKNGEFLGFIAAARDIRERQKTEIRYLEQKKRSEFYLELFGQDVKGLNSGIIRYLEMMLKNLGLQGEEATYVKNVLQQSNQIEELVTNIGHLTLLRENRLDVDEMETIDLLKAAITDIVDKYSNRKIKIIVEKKGNEFVARTHPMLKDVFKNLLDNAVKFDLHTRVVVEVKMTITEDTNWCRYEFFDNGPGITDDHKEYIFDRLDSSVGGPKGSGLGLSVVRGFVKRFGGRVWVIDRVAGVPSKGSRFIIDLPNARRKPEDQPDQ